MTDRGRLSALVEAVYRGAAQEWSRKRTVGNDVGALVVSGCLFD
jgi:hypothetical protein